MNSKPLNVNREIQLLNQQKQKLEVLLAKSKTEFEVSQYKIDLEEVNEELEQLRSYN